MSTSNNQQSSGQQNVGTTAARVANGQSASGNNQTQNGDTGESRPGAAHVNDLNLGDGPRHVDSTIFSIYSSGGTNGRN